MGSNNLTSVALMILLIVFMYFLLIRPQKKREKTVTAMRNAIKVGDEVITIGGICGKIVKTKDDKLTIQVGADKTKFEIMRWAVSTVVSAGESDTAKKTKKDDVEENVETTKKALPKKMKKASQNEEVVSEETPKEAEVIEAENQ